MLWNRVFCTDLLKDRTVVLVTQLTWLLAEADLAITLENGGVRSAERNIGCIRKPKTVLSEEAEKKKDERAGSGGKGSGPNATSGAKHGLITAKDTTTTNENDVAVQTDVDQEVSLTSIPSRLSCESHKLTVTSAFTWLLVF